MRIQVLVSTMFQTDYSLLEKMNISTDAIIINQCHENSFKNIEYKGNKIKIYNFDERGIGRSRNNALLRIDADIGIFADDDVVYKDNYGHTIINAFKENPEADIIIFNIKRSDKCRSKYRAIIKKKRRVNMFNFMRYGTVRIAFKTESIIKNNIWFNLSFGGGCKYGAGEDTLFLRDCIKNKLCIIAVPEYIGKLTDDRPSTWFTGYNEKYFYDKGAFFSAISKKYAYILMLHHMIRHYKMYPESITLTKAFSLMLKGKKDYDNA